jgi:hypothetical protein
MYSICTDPDPDPFYNKQKKGEKSRFLLFCDFIITFIFEECCKYTSKKE